MTNPKPKLNSALRDAAKKVGFLLLVLLFSSRSFADREILVTPGNIDTLPTELTHGDGPVTVHFAPGNYFLTRPLVLPNINGRLLLQAGGRVVISGGVRLSGWKKSTLNGHDCLAAQVPASVPYFREFWVNDRRAIRARFPATGYLSAALPVDVTKSWAPGWNQGQNWFGFKPGDVPDNLPTADVEAVIMNRWVEARMPISTIDASSHKFQSTRKSPFQLLDGDLYYLEGSDRFFDHPGDWYLDRGTRMLYYQPRDGESAENLNGIAPRLPRLLQMSGANDVICNGLSFSHSEWNLPDAVPGRPMEVGGFGQGAVGVPAAISLEMCHACRFESCTFEHLGSYCLEVGRGCQNAKVQRCIFRDFGAGAIKIGNGDQAKNVAGQCFGNSVTDCRISDGGHMFPSACGIWIGESSGNTIAHNEIADLYYTGISSGWTWGYGESLNRDNHFEKNLIHDIGRKSNGDGPILSDMGAIYTLGARKGTLIAENVFHDIVGRVYGGWGIYLDEGSSNVLIEKNLVYKTTHGGFHLHYGHDNIVQQNVFALGRDVQIARTTVEDGRLMLTFKHNVVYWDSGVFTETVPEGLIFADNLYQCIGERHLKFGNKSWDQWQRSGQDAGSVLGDARFANASKADFLIRGTLPGKLQIEPLDVADVGPR
jgi:parallel beta-helix repeat protein